MKTTNKKDKNGKEIFYGSILKCDDGYSVVVVEIDNKLYGKLVCEKDHSCTGLLYALNPEISEVVG